MVPASLGHSTASVQSLCAAQVESRLMLSHAVLAQLKDRGQMTYEERLEAAERHRMTGNALFQQVDGQPINARMCSFGLADIPNEASEASSMLLRALCVFLCTFRVLWHVRCEVRPTAACSVVHQQVAASCMHWPDRLPALKEAHGCAGRAHGCPWEVRHGAVVHQ